MSMLQVKGRWVKCQAGRNTCMTADLPGGARTGGRSSPGIGPAAALAAAAAPLWLVAAAVSVLRRWEGEAKVEPPCEAPSSRRSRDLLAGVRGADNLCTRRNSNIMITTITTRTTRNEAGLNSWVMQWCVCVTAYDDKAAMKVT